MTLLGLTSRILASQVSLTASAWLASDNPIQICLHSSGISSRMDASASWVNPFLWCGFTFSDSKFGHEYQPEAKALGSGLALNDQKQFAASVTVPASRLQTLVSEEPSFVPVLVICKDWIWYVITKVMRLAFKQTTEPVTLDACWPSKMTPCSAGHILTPKRLPPQPLGMKFPCEKHLRDNQLITRRK